MAQNQFAKLRQKTVVKNNLVNPTNLAFCIGGGYLLNSLKVRADPQDKRMIQFYLLFI